MLRHIAVNVTRVATSLELAVTVTVKLEEIGRLALLGKTKSNLGSNPHEIFFSHISHSLKHSP
jgi:hypothetical protein